ncbi:MAG: hypothetical protein ACYC3I_17140, partial [Gemmataceae bacterium]
TVAVPVSVCGDAGAVMPSRCVSCSVYMLTPGFLVGDILRLAATRNGARGRRAPLRVAANRKRTYPIN